MKSIKRDVFGWLIVIAFLIAIFILYDKIHLKHFETKTASYHKDTTIPSELHPTVAKLTEELIQKAKEQGITVVITDGFRSFSEQDELFAKGRSTDGAIVTNARAGESYHNYGLAVDFALRDAAGTIIWDMNYDGNGNGQSDWDEVIAIAKSLGFSWGGDWAGFKDYPHLEMSFGLSLEDLKNGMRPNE